MKKILFMIFLVFIFTGITLAQTGVKKKRPLPHEYGKIILNNYSTKIGLAPVEFDHWLHRAKFTCRLCHVDIGFAMKAGATGIRAADNAKGYYCGACHNGKTEIDKKQVFTSCSDEFKRRFPKTCDRCHSVGKLVEKEYDFDKFAQNLPKERFGNGIDWEKAEAEGLIKPIDFLEGISIKKPFLKSQEDFPIETKIEGMPEIIFSHKKHTVWNGCEVCHPEIFVGVKKGATKYSMIDIFEGRYCGVCHGTVAFPLMDCQRCHIKPVQ